MTLTIYGSPQSRTMRVLWMAAELDLAYDHIPLAFDDPALKQPEFRRVNPAGAIPTLVDNGFALSESLAINLYLAKKYNSDGPAALYPATVEAEADVWRWSLWAQAHLEPWVQRDRLPADLRVAIDGHVRAMVQPALTLLNDTLGARAWLGGGHFSVADLNVASILSPSRLKRLDIPSFEHVRDWLTRCYARPAAVATRQRFQG